MRLDVYGQFVISVVRPGGGVSKARPIAFVEGGDSWILADILIPNGLTDKELERYVADKYASFDLPGRKIRRLDQIRGAA